MDTSPSASARRSSPRRPESGDRSRTTRRGAWAGSAGAVTGILSYLLDVEGTTTPITFVSEVLFPFARGRFAAWLEAHRDAPEVLADVARLKEERGAEPAEFGQPAWRGGSPAEERASALEYVYWLMDRDRKSTGLKSLQGKIWQEGFESGELVAPVYNDVPRALARFRKMGRDVSIFSSGSVLAQRLLFSRTNAGDLRRHLRSYFDTTTGPKREAASYGRIADALGRRPPEILFVSDIAEELDAAREANMATALCARPGDGEPVASRHRVIRTFDEL